MRHFLYLDRRLVLDQLAARERGALDEQRMSQTNEALNRLEGSATAFSILKGGGALERTKAETAEQVVKQIESSEVDRLIGSKDDGSRVERWKLWNEALASAGVRPARSTLVEAVGCLSVPEIYSDIESAERILAAPEARANLSPDSEERLRALLLLAATASPSGPAVILEALLTREFKWICRLDRELLRRPLADFHGPATVLGFVAMTLERGVTTPIFAARGLALLAEADRARLEDVLRSAQRGFTDIGYPAGELLPLAIYREEADDGRPVQC